MCSQDGPSPLFLKIDDLLPPCRHAQRMAGGPAADGLPQALCQAVVQSGFVGISTHMGRLEIVKSGSVPPYDEFRLLEECWKNMRHVVAVSGDNRLHAIVHCAHQG